MKGLGRMGKCMSPSDYLVSVEFLGNDANV
jgi:hypothetical protein